MTNKVSKQLRLREKRPGRSYFPDGWRNQVAQNSRVQNGLIGALGNANLNGNGNLVAASAEGNVDGHNGNKIRCYNCRGVGHYARNCTVRPRR
nr:hypothetical protein [Tanacetum cinerariifolium]